MRLAKLIYALLPHIGIVISVMYVVFYIVDFNNSAMAFIENDITKAMVFALSLQSIVLSVVTVARQRRRISVSSGTDT